MTRRIKMGMVGGGIGSFIGEIHRMAARLDGHIDLVCGAFSSKPEVCKATAEKLGIEPQRSYNSFEEMMKKEKEKEEGERMDFVSIVTPNHLHYLPCVKALENNFHVICDKPLTLTVKEAEKLQEMTYKYKKLFAVTYTYVGGAMVKQARHIIQNRTLGEIQKIVVEYTQGWLSQQIEHTGNRQASWRTDPKKAGMSCCMADIGVHAAHLAEYISGYKIQKVCADLNSVLPRRVLDDDGAVFLRFENGIKGLLFSSQVATGEENKLQIHIYTEKAGLEWSQTESEKVTIKWHDKPTEILSEGVDKEYLCSAAQASTRLPSGHKSGFIESMANIYKNFALNIQAEKENKKIYTNIYDFPSIEEGVRGMQFIQAVVQSNAENQKWIHINSL